MNRIKIFVLSLLFVATSAMGQNVEFKALVTKKKVGKFEKFRIDFVINENVDEIIPPNFSDFAYLGGPSTSVNQSWINGKSSYSKTYSYYLMPKGVGEFTIGSASAVFNGITYKTQPLTMTVLEEKPKSENPNDPESLAAKNVKLVMELSDQNPYVNQQITASYYLYFKLNISSPQVVEMPKYDGFWKQDVEMPSSYKIEKKYLDDELYQSILLKKVILIPQKSGQLKLDPFILDVPVQMSSGRIDFFGNPITQQYNYTISSPEKKVSVKPLPENSKPENFSGAVGDFNVYVKLSKTEVEANESITLKVIVSGKGNFKLFTLPSFKLPEELEVYEPKYSEKVEFSNSGLTGSVSNEYIIIPRFKGTYKLPDIIFTYFDPAKNKYVNFREENLQIKVISGEAPIYSKSETGSTPISKSDVQLMAKDIRFIKSKTEFTERDNSVLIDQVWFYFVLLFPFSAIPILLFVYHKKLQSQSDTVGQNKKKAAKIALKFMSEAKKAMEKGENISFFTHLSDALYKYSALKLNLKLSELNRENIEELFLREGSSKQDVDQLVEILKWCEMAKYSPVSSLPSIKQIYEKSIEVLSNLEKSKR